MCVCEWIYIYIYIYKILLQRFTCYGSPIIALLHELLVCDYIYQLQMSVSPYDSQRLNLRLKEIEKKLMKT